MSARTMRSRRRKIERRAMRKGATLTREDADRAYAMLVKAAAIRAMKGKP